MTGPREPQSGARRLRAIIYDLDGTLVDAFGDIADALNFGLQECGLPRRSVEAVRRFVGNGIEMLVRRGLGRAQEHRLAEVLPLVRKRYEENPGSTTRLYPGTIETLKKLKDAGIAQAILTNKPHSIAAELCARLGLASAVEAVIGDAPGRALKPDPAAARETLEKFGASPEEAAVVGDGLPDAELARRLGCRFFACPWGVLSREELLRSKPDHVLESMPDLARIVLG